MGRNVTTLHRRYRAATTTEIPCAVNVLLTGIAGLVAGAMSMDAGEYVSVSSQSVV
jgi:VIT1/CCC1 family predicted Fe2+/Mn2+ transporter